MNLEVVRLRAVAGRDAGAVAPFAAAALEEQAAVAAMVGALIALARVPSPKAVVDVRAVLAAVVALTAPIVRHRGTTITVVPGGPVPTGAPVEAVRLAVTWALEQAAPDGVTPGAGPGIAGDRSGGLRCSVLAGAESVLVIGPGPGRAGPGEHVPGLLAQHGIRAELDAGDVRVTFPPA